MSDVVIKAQNLVKVFNEKKANECKVLNDVSLEVNKGDVVAIVGFSGSGKSTLLHLLGGLDSPTSGSVHLFGKNFSALSASKKADMRNQHLGFIYQFHLLLPEFTALENVAMPLLVRRMSMPDAKKEAAKVLEKVGLSHRLNHKPGELSGGERQRVAIARAIVAKPDCILADEPTGNLDSDNANKAFDLLVDLTKENGSSLVLITHDERLSKKCSKVIHLDNGILKG